MSARKPPKKRLASVPAPLKKPAANNAKARWQQVGLWTAALITLWVAALHVLNLFAAGPLWRDEVGTVDFAAMPTMGDIWRNLRYDNFPPLFVAIARVWTLVGLSSDFSYRLLGCLIGLGTLGVLWWCVRMQGGKTPLLVLALYAANPLAIRVGDSLRPYGLGIALTLLSSALIWNFVQTPGRRTLFWAALAATLSVQCLYQNAFFIIAFSCGAWVVTLCRREWKTAWQTGIIGLVAVLSLLPYWVNIKNSQEWFGISREKVQFAAIWHALGMALRDSGRWMPLLWLALCIAGLVATIFYGARQWRWSFVYCGTVLAVSAPIYVYFLRALGLTPRSWYFLILMAPAALMVDSILAGMDAVRLRMGRPILASMVVLVCAPACYAEVKMRQSNVDLLAAKLKESAQPGDLIVVSPWYYGVSLQRYFDPSRWTTLPPMEELRIHRYDLMKKAMMTENPIGPLLDKVRETLRSGHNFWMAGLFQAPPDGQPQPVYPPYNGGLERADSVYFSSWMFQVAYLVVKHATVCDSVEILVPGGQALGPYENIQLQVVHGWRE